MARFAVIVEGPMAPSEDVAASSLPSSRVVRHPVHLSLNEIAAAARLRQHHVSRTVCSEVSALFPLHNGQAFGLIGRRIVIASGLVSLVLYVTALRMWWLKRAAA